MVNNLIFLILSLFLVSPISAKEQKIVLAGGCFWCMEKPFEQLEGVKEVSSGFAQGSVKNPSYKQVSSGTSGHLEVVEVLFDDSKISLKEILSVFWQQINPTDDKGQFVDRGQQYTTGIFYNSPEQKLVAEESKKQIVASGIFSEKVLTPIASLKKFFPAEDYHQDYYKKNPVRYWYYRSRSGRDDYLKKIWTQEAKKKWQNLILGDKQLELKEEKSHTPENKPGK